MKLLFCLTVLSGVLVPSMLAAQEVPVIMERQLEQQVTMDGVDPGEDLLVQQMEVYSRHPLDINGEAGEVLAQFGIITVPQLKALQDYRRLFGDLLDTYELQAVPGWDLALARRIHPYISIRRSMPDAGSLSRRFRGGEHSLVLRWGRSLQTGAEYRKDAEGNRKYQGDPSRLFLRYRYVSGNKLQYGITGEKDAGEKFNPAKGGFDFYSAHLFLRDIGILKSVAFGDFTVNMGQGVIHWQSMAFKKSADAMNVKRQSPVLRPYNSAGEANFFRGAGLTLHKGGADLTGFVSVRNISTNHEAGVGGMVFTSFLRSGYNRTLAELADRNNTRQLTAGTVLSYRKGTLRLASNFIWYRFSLPQMKSAEPYNLYAFRGDRWMNGSIDLMYTWKNIHCFAELAADSRLEPAAMGGLVASLGRYGDFSLLGRYFGKAYQTISGNAFSESTMPSNEQGLYAGISFRPGSNWKADFYFDLYHFPWLKYRVSAPSSGRDWMVHLAYVPNRQVEISSRLRENNGERNAPADDAGIMEYPVANRNLNWRTQVALHLSKSLLVRNRTEIVVAKPAGSKGFLASADFVYKPMQKRYDLSVRAQYFTTDDYDSRVYAFENDVLYAQSVPVFSGTGFRYYFLLRWDAFPYLNIWFRYAATNYIRSNALPEDTDASIVPIKTELKIQARFLF